MRQETLLIALPLHGPPSKYCSPTFSGTRHDYGLYLVARYIHSLQQCNLWNKGHCEQWLMLCKVSNKLVVVYAKRPPRLARVRPYLECVAHAHTSSLSRVCYTQNRTSYKRRSYQWDRRICLQHCPLGGGGGINSSLPRCPRNAVFVVQKMARVVLVLHTASLILQTRWGEEKNNGPSDTCFRSSALALSFQTFATIVASTHIKSQSAIISTTSRPVATWHSVPKMAGRHADQLVDEREGRPHHHPDP